MRFQFKNETTSNKCGFNLNNLFKKINETMLLQQQGLLQFRKAVRLKLIYLFFLKQGAIFSQNSIVGFEPRLYQKIEKDLSTKQNLNIAFLLKYFMPYIKFVTYCLFALHDYSRVFVYNISGTSSHIFSYSLIFHDTN